MIRVKKWSMLVEWEDDTYDILDKSNIKNEIKLNKDVKSFFIWLSIKDSPEVLMDSNASVSVILSISGPDSDSIFKAISAIYSP